MNSRQGALLRALLEASDYRTSADYARRLGCSDRTIRTDVKALNAFFEHEGFATRVGRQRGAGLRLSLVPDEENRLVRLLEESETEMHPRYERLCQEMIALTCHPGPIPPRAWRGACSATSSRSSPICAGGRACSR